MKRLDQYVNNIKIKCKYQNHKQESNFKDN